MELEKQDQEFTQKTQFYNEVDFNINSGLSNILYFIGIYNPSV